MAEKNTGDWKASDFEEFEDDEFESFDRDSDFAAIHSEADDEVFIDDEPALWEITEEDERPSSNPEDGINYERVAINRREPANDLPDGTAGEEPTEREGRSQHLSFGMLVIAATAIILLGIGGYGIIEQRAALREEVRQLNARLATAAAPAEVNATRAAAEQAAANSRALAAEVEELSRENRSLQAIVNGLEAQLQTQQQALQNAPTKSAPVAASATSAEKAATTTAEAATTGAWFVNFSSYSVRATADRWADKLSPGEGKVIVATGESNGKTIYRVRVVDLADKTTANSVARALEQQYDLQRLWVGKDQ